MEPIVLNSLAASPSNGQKHIKTSSGEEGTSVFAALLQGLSSFNGNTSLMEVPAKGDLESESLEAIISNIAMILQNSSDPEQQLLKWFNGLTDQGQQDVLQLLPKLISNNPGELGLSKLEAYTEQLFLGNLEELTTFLQSARNKSLEKGILPQAEQLTAQKLGQQLDKTGEQGSLSRISSQSTLFKQQLPIFRNENVIYSEENLSELEVEPQKINLTELQLPNSQLNLSDLKTTAFSKQPIVENLVANQNFTSELGKVLIKHLQLPNGSSETKIQLHPAELGQVDVKLLANNGQITAQLLVETVMGKELLEGQLHQLKQALVSQGYQVEKIEVQQTSASANSVNDLRSGLDYSSQHSGRQQSQQQENRQSFNGFVDEGEEFVNQLFNQSGIDYTV